VRQPNGPHAAPFFDHYIFGEDAAQVADHLPDHARSVLGPPSDERSKKMLAIVMDHLGRRWSESVTNHIFEPFLTA
jgi:hypothetical protein